MEQKIKCVIVDDEPLARELLKSYVEKTPSLELIGCYESAVEAVKTIVSGMADIVFLDINMPILNGIDFASVIPHRTRIIYVTAYEQYALQGFKVNALDYLLKPVNYTEFTKAVAKAMEWCAMRNSFDNAPKSTSGRLAVKADYRLVQLNVDAIKYIEVQKDRVVFNRTNGEPVSSLMSLRDLEETLPSDKFMRVHRSFIVNLDHIEVVERGRIIFGKVYIPISDSKRDEFFARLGK